MVNKKRARGEAETYDSDGGFIEQDDDAPTKKSKKVATSATKTPLASEEHWPLSSGKTPRRVNVSDFKGNSLISIREYYEKDDQMLPGKKGISLTVDQYKELLKVIPKINAVLKLGGGDEDVKEEDEEEKPKKKATSKKEKSNIEETSDEEE